MTDPRTLFTQTGVSFSAQVAGQFSNQLPSNLVGTMTVSVYDAAYPGGSAIIAPTTSGITEASLDGDPANPIYTAALTVDQALPNGQVRFNYPGHQAVLPLVVSEVVPDGTAGYLVVSDVLAGDGLTRDAYEPGSIVQIRINAYLPGAVAVDPVTLALRVIEPATPAVITNYTIDDLERDGQGAYHLNIETTTPSQWVYGVNVTGPIAATGDQAFWVDYSRLA